MANLDFISYPLGEYIQNNLNFGNQLKKPPLVFAMNYFLKDKSNNFCTSKLAKKVWLHWAEMRVHGEVEASHTPTGLIPKYKDLKMLFQELLGEVYKESDYQYQFEFRCDEWLAKLDRSKQYFKDNVPTCPAIVYKKWEEVSQKIRTAKNKYGAFIAP